MKKFFLYGAGVLFILLVVVAIIAPKTEIVERTIIINKPVLEVYSYLVELQNLEEWSPWSKKDPKTIHKYKGVGNSVGSIHSWTSEHRQVGIGEQEITSVTPFKEVVSELRFAEPFESNSITYLKFNDLGISTEVTWGHTSEYNPLQAVFMMAMDMDTYLGNDFDEGLLMAKTILEK